MIAKFKSLPYFTYLVRVVPFVVFAALTLLQGQFGETGCYWIYALKTLIGAWLIWLTRSHVREMRWSFSWEAIVAGVAVFAVWVGLDGHYPPLPLIGERSADFNPLKSYGEGSAMAWMFIAVRILGSSLVVPPLEEVFYRSFLYRFLIKSDFFNVPLSSFNWMAFLVVCVAFGVSHYEWLPGILCAFAYQGLVIRKGRLGDAMTAHAITNFLLGLWVVLRSAYHFW
jgi:CAAX prenyl protease-like protein